jgi:glutamate-ammonia-ligase adenylyltransferase
VYRVDLRLRPDPGSTQVAISTAAAFHYYESFGQNWERAAFIKARPVAGDIRAGEDFLRNLAPYIWRKYLDYNAISDIHAMKRQIHAAKGHAQIAVAGHNLKLGRGGIREIEFFVQSQQLIAGGRQPALRSPQTLEALAQLHALEWIDGSAASEMAQAYRFLRRMEHRLQMMADEQTHTLPATRPELEKFARFAGYRRYENFESELRDHLTRVQSHYAALFEHTPELTAQRTSGNLVFTGDTDDPATVETLSGLGFRNPSAAIAAVKGWHFGRVRAVRTAQARERLTEFTPALLQAFGETADPDGALSHFDKFLSDLPSGLQLFSLLRANPDLLRLVAQIMGSAPRLARILSRRRHLMDGILDPRGLDEQADRDALVALLARERAEAATYEDWLDRARVVGQEQAFLIGVRLLSQAISTEQAGRSYSQLADALIMAMHASVTQDMRRLSNGGEIGQAAIIGMGKLGGEEMTSASDLDLIVVYDAPKLAEAGAGQSAPQFYARLTQRLISALSAQTAQGALYDVDMRLRPSGKAGPVAVSADGFANYQRTQAWTWEHLALTRARVISGSDDLRSRLETDIREVLCTPRDRNKVVADVRAMRDLTLKEKDKGDPWDLKNSRGGLLDIEFIAQFLQIVHAADAPHILSPNTTTALRNLKASGLLEAGAAETLIEAAVLYQCVMQILRLCTEGKFSAATAPAGLKLLLAQAAHSPDFERLELDIAEAYRAVSDLFETIVV